MAHGVGTGGCDREPPPYLYRAYGLEIGSWIELPELLEGGAGRDLVIRPAAGLAPPVDESVWTVDGGAVVLRYPGVGTLRVEGGREVLVDVVDPCDPFLRLVLTGAALGLALHQRGLLVVHGSVVAVGDAAAAFVGDPGAGKSTTAAAFAARGHAVISDDVVAVDPDVTPVTVAPGFPQLKLWPEALASLGEDPETLPRVRPEFEKRGRRLGDDFGGAPLPLAAVYALAEGPAAAVLDLGEAAAAMELVKNAYAREQLDALGDAGRSLRQCAALAARVRVRRLERPLDLSRLGSLVSLVADDVQRATTGSGGHL